MEIIRHLRIKYSNLQSLVLSATRKVGIGSGRWQNSSFIILLHMVHKKRWVLKLTNWSFPPSPPPSLGRKSSQFGMKNDQNVSYSLSPISDLLLLLRLDCPIFKLEIVYWSHSDQRVRPLPLTAREIGAYYNCLTSNHRAAIAQSHRQAGKQQENKPQ